MAARTRTQPAVLKYMHTHAGEIIHYMDVSRGLNNKYSDNAVATCLARMVKVYPELGITRHGAGSYLYRVSDSKAELSRPVDSHPRAGDVFEVVVATANGMVLLKDEKGDKVYKLGEEV